MGSEMCIRDRAYVTPEGSTSPSIGSQRASKYLEGSMYLNFYLEGLAGVFGSLLSLALYKPIKMLWSFFISILLTFFGVLGLLVFQEGYLPPFWIKPFLIDSVKDCPYPDQEGKDCRQYYLGCLLYTSPSPRDRTRSRMPSSA